MQKGSIYIIISIYWKHSAVSLSINDLLDLCPNIWCNNSKATSFRGDIFFDLVFYFVFTKKCMFPLCNIFLTCIEVLLIVPSVLIVIIICVSPEVTKESSIGGPEQINKYHSLKHILTQISWIGWRTYQPIHFPTYILFTNWRAYQLPRGIKNYSQLVLGVITWATCQLCIIKFWISVHLIWSILYPSQKKKGVHTQSH